MKYTIDSFDSLQDLASYIGKNYLKCPLSDNILDQITYLNAAFLFLLDRSYFKENAGEELTSAAKEAIWLIFDPSKLSSLAITMNEEIKDPLMFKNQATFYSYYSMLCETEQYIENAKNDEIGLLTLNYLGRLGSLIEIDAKTKGLDPLKVNEIVFLNGTYSIGLILKGFFKKKFRTLKSFDFFDEVSLHAARVRSEILD